MVSFSNPAYLLLLLLVPPLLWWWLHQPRRALRHSLVGRLLHLPVGRSQWARRTAAFLRGLALTLLIVALAGPRWPDRHSRIDTEGIAIVMLVDVSGSMAERDFSWQGQPISRLEAVKKVFGLFVRGSEEDDLPEGSAQDFEGRPSDLIGVVVFATRPETLCPLTLSHSVLVQMLKEEQPRAIPGESETNLIDAIALGLHRLHAAGPRRKVLVLLSDGEHNVPQPRSGWRTPRQAAQVAAGLHIPIYTIDAGNTAATSQVTTSETSSGSSASPAQIRAQAVKDMTDLAQITHGRAFAAHDTEALLAACRNIDSLERSDIHSFQYRRYYEAYPWLGLASFLSVCLALFLEQAVWRRLP